MTTTTTSGAADLPEALTEYLEAQDALDNREYAGINAEPYELLVRSRNHARTALDAALTAQAISAEPAVAGYAALPEPYCYEFREPKERYITNQMYDFADRTHALRIASHGQAPAHPVVPHMSAYQVRALPAEAREYIHQLETNADPSGMVRENMQLHDTNAGLQIMYRKAMDAAQTVVGCFDAAFAEGLNEAISGTTDERLKDLLERRLMHALYAAQEITAEPATPTPQAADTEADTFTPYGSVTTHSVTGQQFFYAKGESPYLDNASECVTVYAKEKHPRQSDQDTAQVAGHDTGGTSSTGGAGADQHNQHRVGEPVTQRAASDRDSRSTGLHGSRDVSQEVTAQAPAQGAAIAAGADALPVEIAELLECSGCLKAHQKTKALAIIARMLSAQDGSAA